MVTSGQIMNNYHYLRLFFKLWKNFTIFYNKETIKSNEIHLYFNDFIQIENDNK